MHLIVASGSEAGGTALVSEVGESNLMGTFALVPQVADAVRVPSSPRAASPMAARSRRADAGREQHESVPRSRVRGIDAPPDTAPRSWPRAAADAAHARIHRPPGKGHPDRMAGLVDSCRLPCPIRDSFDLLAPLTREALSRDRVDLVSLWAGQAAPLVKHRRATDVFDALVSETTRSSPPGATAPSAAAPSAPATSTERTSPGDTRWRAASDPARRAGRARSRRRCPPSTRWPRCQPCRSRLAPFA